MLSIAGCTSATVKSVIAQQPRFVGRGQQKPDDVVSIMAMFGGVETHPVQFVDAGAHRVVFVNSHPMDGHLMNCIVMDAIDDGDGWSVIEIRSDGISSPKAMAVKLWKAYEREMQKRGLRTQTVVVPTATPSDPIG